MNRISGILLILLPLFVLFSCAPGMVALPPAGERESVSYSARWEKLKHVNELPEILRSIADIDLNSPDGRYHLKAALLLKRPNLVRIESIPLFGPPNFFLTLNGEFLKIFLPGKEEFYIGRPSPENLAHFLPVVLSPENLVAFLMGSPPPVTDKNLSYREPSTDNGNCLAIFSNDREILRLWLTDDGEHVKEMQVIKPDGDISCQVIYGDYRRIGEHQLPGKVTLITPGRQARIVVRYREMELSKAEETDEALFNLIVPAGIKPILIDKRKELSP